MEIQSKMVEKDVEVNWDCRGDDLPKTTQYICKAWSPIIYPIQNCDEYGLSVPTIPPFNSKDEDTSML